jgi:hypothetical protein
MTRGAMVRMFRIVSTGNGRSPGMNVGRRARFGRFSSGKLGVGYCLGISWTQFLVWKFFRRFIEVKISPRLV